MIKEDTLGNGESDGRTEKSKEDYDGRTDGNIRAVEYRLDDVERLLVAEADTEAKQDLVTDPFASTGMDVEGGEKTSANGHEDSTEDEERSVVANLGNDEARGNGAHNDGHNGRKQHETRMNGIHTFDCLEPNRR